MASVFEDLAIGLEDHVVVGAGDAVGVAAGGLDGERRGVGRGIRRNLRDVRVDGEGERERKTDRVETGTEVGGGCGQDEADGPKLPENAFIDVTFRCTRAIQKLTSAAKAAWLSLLKCKFHVDDGSHLYGLTIYHERFILPRLYGIESGLFQHLRSLANAEFFDVPCGRNCCDEHNTTFDMVNASHLSDTWDFFSPETRYLAITPVENATHLCGVVGGGPVSTGHVIDGDVGSVAESEVCANTTEPGINTRAKRSDNLVIP